MMIVYGSTHYEPLARQTGRQRSGSVLVEFNRLEFNARNQFYIPLITCMTVAPVRTKQVLK